MALTPFLAQFGGKLGQMLEKSDMKALQVGSDGGAGGLGRGRQPSWPRCESLEAASCLQLALHTEPSPPPHTHTTTPPPLTSRCSPRRVK